MKQVTIFRLLVVASLVIAILGACVDFLVPGLLPQALDDAYDAYAAAEDPSLSHALALGGVALVLFTGAIVGTIGLLLFKSWSRPLSLSFTVFAMFSYPFLGPVLYSGLANMLTEISMMLWGAALAMAYFADIKVRFSGDFANGTLQAPRA